MPQQPYETDTIVVGAGPSGLAVGACLAKAGVRFEIIEAADRVGWHWHNHYERLARQFGYDTRADSQVPWDDVPEKNRALMIATCQAVIEAAEENQP